MGLRVIQNPQGEIVNQIWHFTAMKRVYFQNLFHLCNVWSHSLRASSHKDADVTIRYTTRITSVGYMVTQWSGGGPAPPSLAQNVFIFIQFLWKNWPNNRLAPPPFGVSAPPLGNPGSATAVDLELIKGATETLAYSLLHCQVVFGKIKVKQLDGTTLFRRKNDDRKLCF